MAGLQHTPLNELHRAAGARMVDFGGWEMPVAYGSQIDEHHAVRRDAGMFDVSHMLSVDVTGPRSREFLRHALANDVAKLTTQGKALYSCLLDEHGGVLDDLIAYRFSDDRYRLVVNAATADKDLVWLERLAAAYSPPPRLTPRRDLVMIAVQGPAARERVWRAMPGSRAASEALPPFHAVELGDAQIARTGYTGEDGFEIALPSTQGLSLWSALARDGVHPCGLGARDTLRLEAGMNLYGQDMDERVTPLESGLAWTVDLKSERDFVGRAALAASSPSRRQVGLKLLDKGGVLRAHQRIFTAHGDGEVTSGSFSPTLNASIALARVPAAVAVADTVEVQIRDKRVPARVVKPPFVRNGRILVE